MTNKVTGLRLSDEAVEILRRCSFEARVSMSAIVDYLIIYNLKNLPPYDPSWQSAGASAPEASENVEHERSE